MYLVKTKLDRSSIEGIGVFAVEDIPKGTIIWKFIEGVDRAFDVQEIRNLPEAVRQHIRKHGFLNNGKIILCADYGQFENHSDTPNDRYADGMTTACRDIKAGEELTCDYREFAEETRDGFDF